MVSLADHETFEASTADSVNFMYKDATPLVNPVSAPELEPPFRIVRSSAAIIFQGLSLVAMAGLSFVLPAVSTGGNRSPTDAYSVILYTHTCLWVTMILIDCYLRRQHNILHCSGYIYYYQLTRRLRRANVYIVSAGSTMLLLLSVLVDNYCHDRGACPGSSLKPVNYIQILLTLETILALPFLIKYLADATSHIWWSGQRTITHRHGRERRPSTTAGASPQATSHAAGGDPEARATASGTEPPTPCNSILATPPAMLAAPAGSAEVIRTPADDIPHAALHDVWRVAVKLPLFWADSPEAWFTRVEAQFFLARITQDRTHYDYVVAHLDARYANEVRDILANPPMANLYEHLNTELIRRLSLSEDQKVRQLQSTELAERKPSQLLHHMRALAGNMEVTNSLLRALWLQRLPPHVQAILQAQLTLPLDQLAEIDEHLAPHVRRSLAS